MSKSLSSTVLIVDDQDAVREALELLLSLHGLRAESAATASEALVRIERGGIAAVVQDMNFSRDTISGDEGIDLFRRIRALVPTMPILLMTAWTSLETAVALVRDGAADYVQKPWRDDKLVASLKNLVRLRELTAEGDRRSAVAYADREALARVHDLRGLEYVSPNMHRTVELALRVAMSDAPILILGPNGTGKEKLAEIIVHNSKRKDRPFIRVDAGAIPESLLESELFGVEPGAFTGATKSRVGYFEAAHGGTLFLDEIGNISRAGQQRLLRVLQTGELQRLGSSHVRHVDVRVVSATNEDLRAAIDQRLFREDLYFRLNVVELVLPSLAERSEDVPLLAATFLARAGSSHRLSDSAVRALEQHDYPGNVRELENRITRATLVCRSGVIEPADLGLVPARDTLLSLEAIERALVEHDGNVSRAAARLGVSRQALYRRMDKLEIRRSGS